MKKLVLTAICALAVSGPVAIPQSIASRDGGAVPGASVVGEICITVSDPDVCAALCVFICE